MSYKFSQALTLMREAFEDAQSGDAFMAGADLMAEVDGAQAVINAASAVQVLRVAQFAGREEEQDSTGVWVDVDHGVGYVNEFAGDCFGPALSMGRIAASRKVQAAAILAAKLPATLAAMSAGDLDPWRATIIATQLAEASRASCAAVEALIYPSVLDHTPGEVTKKVRRVLGRVDADALRVKAAKNAWTGSCAPTPPRSPGSRPGSRPYPQPSPLAAGPRSKPWPTKRTVMTRPGPWTSAALTPLSTCC